MNTVRHLLVIIAVLLIGLPYARSQERTTTASLVITGARATPSEGYVDEDKRGMDEEQVDTLPGGKKVDSLHKKKHTRKPPKLDSLGRPFHDPRRATLYSTFFPGLGQFYNRKYWKIPLAWAAVGIPAYLYFDNKGWYQKCQKAIALVDIYTQGNGGTLPQSAIDSISPLVDPKLRTYVQTGDDNSLRVTRNQARQYQDYSVIFFLLLWGVNIVDATVDAHLINFDISNELSMRLQPPSGTSLIGGLSGATGISLVFDLHKSPSRSISLP